MCDYSLIIKSSPGEEKKLMESVEVIERQGDSYRASNIFGEEVNFVGEFLMFDGNTNRIIFLERKGG